MLLLLFKYVFLNIISVMEQPNVPKHALILFDCDGCTFIVTTKKLISETELKPNLKCVFYHCRTEYRCEILMLSGKLNMF